MIARGKNGFAPQGFALQWYTVFMKIHHYTAVFRKEPEGGYTVIIPALSGCVTWGKTVEDATAMAKEAIEAYLGSLAKDDEAPPHDVNFVSTIDISHTPASYA